MLKSQISLRKKNQAKKSQFFAHFDNSSHNFTKLPKSKIIVIFIPLPSAAMTPGQDMQNHFKIRQDD